MKRDVGEKKLEAADVQQGGFLGFSFTDSSYWYQEDTVTLFTTDGLVQIGGSLRRISPEV
jgi:hypothetical protein